MKNTPFIKELVLFMFFPFFNFLAYNFFKNKNNFHITTFKAAYDRSKKNLQKCFFTFYSIF